jgi:Polysaccharide lyase
MFAAPSVANARCVAKLRDARLGIPDHQRSKGYEMASITSFSAPSGSRFTVDGESVEAANANKSWSLTEPDANTLQFSVHSGDNWSTSGWSDLTNDRGANRSEVEFSPTYAAGTQINVSEQLTVQPGPTNTASFLDLNQLHSTTQSPPSPFTLQLDQSDHLEVVLQSPGNSYNLVYRSPNPIVRGQAMDLNFQLNMNPSGSGYVGVWLDGTQIVNYHGAVGAAGAEYYWKEGIYRGAASETITADFSNVQITTGSQPPPTGGTTGTGSGSTGSGTTPPVTGSGTTVGTGASGGATPPTGTGSGTTVGTGASGGATPPTGTGSGTTVGTGASGGATPPTGTGSGTTVGTGASGGATPPTGTGSGTHVGTGASGGVTPPKVPVLTVADHSLSVSPGHGVALGVGVSVPNAGDNVKVHIAGLAKYETITDNLDHKTFSGSSVTLTAAEVNSGLTLHSSYGGHGSPTSTLTVTATDKTGTPVTSAAQTITVKDPPTSVAGGGTSSGGGTTGSNPGTGSDPHHGWGQAGHNGHGSWGQTGNNGHSDHGHWFGHHPDFAPVATTLSDVGASKSAATPSVATAAASTGSAGAKSYALLNQMMAGDSGHDSHFAQVATAAAALLQHSPTSLTKPLH